MRARQALRTAAVLAAPLWWAATFAATPALAAQDQPNIQVSAFPYQPDSLNYFEDSDVVLFHDFTEGIIYRSTDAGAGWDKVTAIPAEAAVKLIMHEFDNNRAYVLTDGIVHYRTEDRGKSWQTFKTGFKPSRFVPNILAFHANDPNRIIFNGIDFDTFSINGIAMYTTDGFHTDALSLRGNSGGCTWAKSTELFSSGDSNIDADRVLCVAQDNTSIFKQDQRLVVSDAFFRSAAAGGPIQEFEPDLDDSRPVQGVTSVVAVQKFLLVAATSLNTDEMALFISNDTLHWHRAMFPAEHRIYQEAYTVLESSAYSLQIDVMNTRPSNPTGVLFTSNSDGTYFTENLEFTNRNLYGHVDFEKISGVQGIFLVNRVANGDAVNNARAAKEIVTEITFDDGRTFAPISVAETHERLHLHSVTELNNVGRVFSSPAPGLIMGNGNTGTELGDYANGNLYVSDDAGVTWIESAKGPHKYEFGDLGSILLAVRDASEVDELTYSLDHGRTWRIAKLPDGLRVRPYILTTTQDSTSLKFLLVGESNDRWHIISIDFSGLHEATCKDSDLEDWWARVDEKGEPTCLMGHKQKYRRRKKDAKCFLNNEFQDPVVETIDCACSDLDFECDFNFHRDDQGACVPTGPIALPSGACGADAKPEDTFMGSSGWRLIPGNTCKRGGGPQKDDFVQRKCADSSAPPSAPVSGDISSTLVDFGLDGFDDFLKYYLERGDSSTASEETIFMRPVDRVPRRGGPIYLTNDHGKTWTRPAVFDDVAVWDIVPHDYFKEVVFFVTEKTRVIYTVDHGQHWHEFEAPYPPDIDDNKDPLMFHPDRKDWLIWVGKKCEGTGECFLEASYSKDRGDNWNTLLRYVERCEFIGSSAYRFRKAGEVLCLAHAHEGAGDFKENPLQLVSSDDWFAEHRVVHAENVRGFATMAEFVFVAAENAEKDSLQAIASLDGESYAEAHFPANLAAAPQHEYTVLDSSTHAVNLFVASETAPGKRWGKIVKSNSNGTSYVLSIAGVNCNDNYFVDFEKILGLEGVVVVNVVANRDDAKAASKVLQTQISHNDGAEWAFLPPPVSSVDGKAYGCKPSRGASQGGDPACALHIHGYTEREDHRRTYSSSGAVGLMLGLGNVGASLGPLAEADTFMTTDAGLTWRNVKKGRWQWQFGDQGSIIVLVQLHTATRTLSYTTDEGATWQDYVFSDKDVLVGDITTLRSGASRNFLLWCKSVGAAHVFTINVDFTGLTDQPCQHDEKDLARSDYYLWSPSHPLLPDSQCLFGHVSQYLRKKTSSKCYNGYKIRHLASIDNCTCTRRDYECDYNFELDNHGQCSLVPGLASLPKDQWCSDHPDAVDYYPPTGFRRIPLTTCQGGDELDKLTEPQPCKNHEVEFEDRHRGPSAVVIVFAVLLPVALATAAGWYVYRNWTGKFGAIRLGEPRGGIGGGASSSSSTFVLNSDAPYIRYPVMAAAAVVAVASTLPLLATALWRTAAGAVERRTGWHVVGSGSGGGASRGGGGGWSRLGLNLGGGPRRFTTRDSFARGRGDYVAVEDDEGELLGDDSDDEV